MTIPLGKNQPVQAPRGWTACPRLGLLVPELLALQKVVGKGSPRQESRALSFADSPMAYCLFKDLDLDDDCKTAEKLVRN